MDRARAILLALIGALFTLSLLLVLPFIQYFLLAVLLAYPLRPLQKRYEGRFGPRLTAGTLVLATTVAIILPVLWISRTVFREMRVFIGRVRRGKFTFDEFEQWVFDVTGEEIEALKAAQTMLRETGIGTVDGALGLFGTITNMLIGVALMMFLLYYFLKDADKFNHWLRLTLPLPDHIYTELRQELDDIVWAVLASHVLIAVIQGIVAGVGLVVLGIPNAVFWTAVMVFLAVLPIIGSFLVWGPAALYLFSIGRPLAGGTLLVYGAIVVSFSDDFLRPLIIDRYTETRLNPSAVVVGILGGVYLLGFIGIFFGPVIIGSLRGALDVYRREYVDSETPDQSDDEKTDSTPKDSTDTAEKSERTSTDTADKNNDSSPESHGDSEDD